MYSTTKFSGLKLKKKKTANSKLGELILWIWFKVAYYSFSKT